MLQFGILSKNEIPTTAPRAGDRCIALTLLKEFSVPLSEEDEARLAVLYGILLDETGSGMITYPGRFSKLDDVIEQEIDRAFGKAPVRLREMAASNAVTSLELFDRLKKRGNITFLATDFFDAVYVVPTDGWSVVFDAEGKPAQFVGERLVIPLNRKIRRKYWINRYLRNRLTAKVLPKAQNKQLAAERIDLFHPRCLATMREDRRFTLSRESVFEPNNTTCDVLRIMNLRPVNLAPACSLVSDSGLLILGNGFKVNDPLNATIFRRTRNRFDVIRDIGAGYERKQVILEIGLSAVH